MENSEEVLAVLTEITQPISSQIEDVFDLYFTNKRLIVLNKKWRPRLFKQAIDLWERMHPSRKREKIGPLKASEIDEFLEKDKSSMALNYDDLDWIFLKKSFFGRCNLNIKGKKILKYINIDKEQFNTLSEILPKIDSLKGKLEINQ